MSDEHLDRQPPRDEAEERLQDELMGDGAAEAATETSTGAAAADLDEPA